MLKAVWIEIPVNDLERAMAFYQAVFDLEATPIVEEDVRRTKTLSNAPEGGPGISLNKTANFTPHNQGVLVYMDCGADSAPTLAKVEAAGGKIIEPETTMGSAGYYATILDTEGNMLALYSYR